MQENKKNNRLVYNEGLAGLANKKRLKIRHSFCIISISENVKMITL